MLDNYVDISSNNAAPDLVAHHAAGHRRLMLKATEGLGYSWGGMPALARQWHSLGADCRVGYYHWLYGTLSGAAQAQFFWSKVSPVWRAGDWMMTDFEDVDPSRWVPDLVHRNVLAEFDSALAPHGPVHDYAPNWYIANLPLVRAYLAGRGVVASDYSHDPALNPYGLAFSAHQFTDRATVAGMPGPVDYNRWLSAGETPSSQPSQPLEDELSAADVTELKKYIDAAMSGIHAKVDPTSAAVLNSLLPAVADIRPRITRIEDDAQNLRYGVLDPDVGERAMVGAALTRLANLQKAVDALNQLVDGIGTAVTALHVAQTSGGPVDLQPIINQLTALPAQVRAEIKAHPLTITGAAS